MDKTDMSLIILLTANSRQSYAELAKKLGLSINAVHKRIQLLVESGVIRRFTAKVGILAAPAIVVFISGTSTLPSLQDLPAKMKAHGSIYWLAEGGGKFIYTGAYLHNVNEVLDLTRYVQKEAGISEPRVGILAGAGPSPIIPTFKPSDLVLCDLDYRIMRSLKDDSRKAVSDISGEIGVSAKTVRRRLNRMKKNFLIELGLEWYPDKSNDIMTLVDVQLKPGADLGVIPFQILRKYAPNTLFFWCFANLPNIVTYTVWTNSMGELERLREKLEKEPAVAAVVPNILFTGFMFPTWRDKFAEKA